MCIRDSRGTWASTGCVDQQLLEAWLGDSYFSRPAPKSTGREYFNLHWVKQGLAARTLEPQDVQRTLLEVTVSTISEQLLELMPSCRQLLVCGGGVHNHFMLQRLKTMLSEVSVQSTAHYGVDPNHIESTLFAWLAGRTLNGLSGNLPAVTGASGERILGALYPT